jgi:hypothetical protein
MGIYDNEHDPNVEMWEKENNPTPQSRNFQRVLTDEQISSIYDQLVILFRDDAEVMAETMLNNYLADDKDMLWDNIVELIEAAEDGKLLSIEQLNMTLKEDSTSNEVE